MVEALDLTIAGMHCRHCVVTIREALLGTRGVLWCEVRMGGARVALDGDPLTRGELIAGIRKAGAFEVTAFAPVKE